MKSPLPASNKERDYRIADRGGVVFLVGFFFPVLLGAFDQYFLPKSGVVPNIVFAITVVSLGTGLIGLLLMLSAYARLRRTWARDGLVVSGHDYSKKTPLRAYAPTIGVMIVTILLLVWIPNRTHFFWQVYVVGGLTVMVMLLIRNKINRFKSKTGQKSSKSISKP